MTDVAFRRGEKPNTDVEIVVHVDGELGQTQRGELLDYLTATDGVTTAVFCPLRFHLMLVKYDRTRITSQDVIRRVNSRKIRAELIGPM